MTDRREVYLRARPLDIVGGASRSVAPAAAAPTSVSKDLVRADSIRDVDFPGKNPSLRESPPLRREKDCAHSYRYPHGLMVPYALVPTAELSPLNFFCRGVIAGLLR